MNFAQRLTEVMHAKGINKTQLGAAVGVSYQAAGQWAIGGHGPVVSKLKRIADALSVPPHELLMPLGSPITGIDSVENTIQFPESLEEVALVLTFRKMKPELRTTLAEIAITLANSSASSHAPSPTEVRKENNV